jgi:hypothetical protein
MKSRKEIEERIAHLKSALDKRPYKQSCANCVANLEGQIEALNFSLSGSDKMFDCGWDCGTQHIKQESADRCRTKYGLYLSTKARRDEAKNAKLKKYAPLFIEALSGKTFEELAAKEQASVSAIGQRVTIVAHLLRRLEVKDNVEVPARGNIHVMRRSSTSWIKLLQKHL